MWVVQFTQLHLSLGASSQWTRWWVRQVNSDAMHAHTMTRPTRLSRPRVMGFTILHSRGKVPIVVDLESHRSHFESSRGAQLLAPREIVSKDTRHRRNVAGETNRPRHLVICDSTDDSLMLTLICCGLMDRENEYECKKFRVEKIIILLRIKIIAVN